LMNINLFAIKMPQVKKAVDGRVTGHLN
jgi:hypothetical protein